MRLKSRPVVLKKTAPCRLCGKSFHEGYLLKGPSKGFVCEECHEKFYAPLIEESRFRLTDLAAREFWSPLIVKDGETAMAYLKASHISQVSIFVWWGCWSLLVILLILARPSFADISGIPGRIVSIFGRAGTALADLSVPGSRIALLPGRLFTGINYMIKNISDLIGMFSG